MDHPGPVCGGDGLADLQEVGQQARQVGASLLTVGENVLEGLAGEQLHHDERLPLRRQGKLVDRDDAGMSELAGEPGLAEKPAQSGGPSPLLPIHELDGHAPLELGVPALEYDAHAAATYLPADQIAMPRGAGVLGVLAAGGFVLSPTQQAPEPVAYSRLAQRDPGMFAFLGKQGDAIVRGFGPRCPSARHGGGQVVIHHFHLPVPDVRADKLKAAHPRRQRVRKAWLPMPP